MLQLLADAIHGEAAQRLIDQFNAEFHRAYNSLSGSVGFDSSGLYRSEARVASDIGPYPGKLTWVIKRTREGAVVSVEVTGEGGRWRESAEAFFRKVLSNTLTDRCERFVHRTVFHYFGPNLAGEYWFGQVRVAPFHPDDETPRDVRTERVLVVDHFVEAPDRVKAFLLGDEIGRRYGARIAFLLDVGLRREIAPRRRWITLRRQSAPAESLRGTVGVRVPHNLDRMPDKGEFCPMGRFDGSGHLFARSGPLSFPSYARSAWRSAEGSPGGAGGIFDAMCQLYQVGLVIEEHYPTAALAYFVASAETASRAPESGGSFGELVRRHSASTTERTTLVDRLYGELRSGHLHAGSFPLGDYKARGTNFIGDVVESLRGDFYFEGRKLIREVLTAWTVSTLESHT